MSFKKHLLGLSLVAILSGVASYSNVIEQLGLASVSGCYTQSDINNLLSEKGSLELQMADIDNEIVGNTNNIVALQESLVANQNNINSVSGELSLLSDYYLGQIKKTVDSRYTTYINKKNTSTKNLSKSALAMLDKQIASYKKTYEDTLKQYNESVTKREALKQKILTLNNEKTVLDAQIVSANLRTTELNTLKANLQTQLNSSAGLIESAYNNICPTIEGNCNDRVDNDKDGSFDCSDTDCTSDVSCTTTVTTTTGCTDPCNSSCINYNPSDSSCSTGVTTITTGCISNSDCGTNQTCSAGSCVDSGVIVNGSSGSSGTDGVNSVDAVGGRNGKTCCVCFYGEDKASSGLFNSCSWKEMCSDVLEKHPECDMKKEIDVNVTESMSTDAVKFCDPANNNIIDTKVFVADHSCPSNIDMCGNVAMYILEKTNTMAGYYPSNVSVTDLGCKAYSNLEEAEKYAEKVRTYLKENNIDSEVILTANQNYMTWWEINDYCQTPATFYVCQKHVTKEVGDCPREGSICITEDFGKSPDPFQCKKNGVEVTMRCVPDSDGYDGTYQY